MGTTLLQLLIVLSVFVIGALTTLAVQYGLAHYRPHGRGTDGNHDASHSAGLQAGQPADNAKTLELPAEARDKLLKVSQQNFQEVLDKAADHLEQDLQKTAGELNQVLQKIGAQVVGNEMERYRVQLDQIRQEAATAIGGAQSEISKHQAELKAELEEQHAASKAKLADDIMAEKQRLVQEIMAEKKQIIDQLDTKLADAVASFLMESLGHNVDLGAQQAYLTGLLAEHKDDFKRAVNE